MRMVALKYDGQCVIRDCMNESKCMNLIMADVELGVLTDQLESSSYKREQQYMGVTPCDDQPSFST